MALSIEHATAANAASRHRTGRATTRRRSRIGSLKARTDAHATRHGRPGLWTWDDVAGALLEANIFA